MRCIQLRCSICLSRCEEVSLVYDLLLDFLGSRVFFEVWIVLGFVWL